MKHIWHILMLTSLSVPVLADFQDLFHQAN